METQIQKEFEGLKKLSLLQAQEAETLKIKLEETQKALAVQVRENTEARLKLNMVKRLFEKQDKPGSRYSHGVNVKISNDQKAMIDQALERR